MQFVVAKPKFLMDTYDGNIIDSWAIARSLTLNGVPFDPTVSSEWMLVVSGEYVSIHVDETKKDFQLVLNADTYNDIRSTKYRFPRDILLVETDLPRAIEISPVGLPRDRTYQVDMYGYDGLTPDAIAWYIHHDSDRTCEVSDSWDSLSFEKVKTIKIDEGKSSQIDTASYMLDYDNSQSRVCIIAGVGGDFQTIVDRHLREFSASTNILDMLSPEYDMQSRIEFTFSEDIYTDTGKLYSPEYMKNRSDAKIAFLKQLDISPNVPLTEANISLTPDRASIIGAFQEWQKYMIRLNDVPDIYGRKVKLEMDFTPIRKPFLSLGLEQRRTIFRVGEDIHAKLYALKTPKNEYTLKLCRISLEWYAKVERMIQEAKEEYTPTLYTLLSSSETSSCTKKDIVISSGSLMAPFRVQDFESDKELSPWLYVLAFRNADDVGGFDRFVSPRVFSVVDSHITMKVDASGKMSFLVTDINTGKPLTNQTLTLSQNITRSYTEQWNQTTRQYDISYLPLSNASFTPSIMVGQTDAGGFLTTEKKTLKEDDYNTPYWLSHEYEWDSYEWRYNSFIATSVSDGHFGYVVSTWNDGITGWNFGLKDSDYSWETRPKYSAYIHTDRLLYLPGEKVYVRAILRENDTALRIPSDTNFLVKVTDPIGTEIKNITMKPNEYGTISFDLSLDQEASLGSYSVSIVPFENQETYISNGYTTFQVEVFKNPTFTAEVSLQSPDIEEDIVTSLRKNVNTDPSQPWYTDVYASTIALEGIVKAHYYNGAQMRGVPFTYRIYRNEHFSDLYWNDCFWWCYWQPSPEFYTEGTGSIDSEGMGFFRIPVEFSSFNSDYIYTAEVTITDPMTGEEVVTPATLLAKIPAAYKTFWYDNPIEFIPTKKIIKPGEKIAGSVKPRYGQWDMSLVEKYTYNLIHRTYQTIKVDDLRMSTTVIPVTQDTIVASGALVSSGISLDTRGMSPGEYHLQIVPKSESKEAPPETSISDTLLYITGDFVNKDTQLRVIPEKTVYRIGEKARVFITTPFTGGYLYLTRERGGVIDHEYIPMTGNTYVREYTIDESSVPNVYIWVVAFPPSALYGERSYAVGYGEIVTDLSDKKARLQVTPNKEQYMNREQVTADVILTDRFWNPLQWELAVMVVDESLIRLLGNIDLDIIPKFFQKFPFTMKTSLSAIGLERNRFLSRKGSNGGSGDKGAGGTEISSRVLFKNTAYYNPSIVTDATGRAKITFTLPDNVTDYRIITIGQTKTSHFAVSEKTIAVRRDYTLESHVPYISYPWDTTTITASAFNATKKVTSATLTLSIGTGSNLIKKEQNIILNPNESKGVEFILTIPKTWKDYVSYTLSLTDKGNILDSVTKNIRIPEIPLLETTYRTVGVMTGSKLTLTLPSAAGMDFEKSRVSLQVSSSLLLWVDAAVKTLIQYPYGCVEQTISSTLPNALALKFQTLIGTTIEAEKAKEYLETGVKKILRMQHYSGGWKYWEQDDYVNDHVTPYVVRSLFAFRDLWVEIPEDSINNGINFIVWLIDNGSALFENDPDFRAEVFWTLARVNHERSKTLLRVIDPTKLSRHGYLAYAYGLHYLKQYNDSVDKRLALLMNASENSDYWYWDRGADTAIYAQLLIDRGNITNAFTVLDATMRETDLSSYYISTQEKIQLLMALVKYNSWINDKNTAQIAVRAQWLIADLSLSPSRTWQKVDTTRSKVGDTIEITREAKTPTFYELIVRDTPADIFTMKPTAKWNIAVSRTFEKIDESRWVDKDGVFIAASPVPDNIFEKWQLYRVTLEVSLPDYVRRSWHHLALEDFVPGGWRPIRGIFKTESVFTSDAQDGYYWSGWSHVEAKDDRILAMGEWGYGDKQTYTYYFRPEFVGTYLLPPVTAYFMYRPEVFALGKYEKVVVK